MVKKKKSFCNLTAKVYGGKPGDKTLAIHFSPKDRLEVIKLASAMFQALAHGKGVEITLFTHTLLKSNVARITVTAPK